jgi:hypothetical protein
MSYFYGRKNPRIWLLIGLIIICGSIGFNPFRADSAESLEYYANEILSFLIIFSFFVVLLGLFYFVFKYLFGSKKSEFEKFGVEDDEI